MGAPSYYKSTTCVSFILYLVLVIKSLYPVIFLNILYTHTHMTYTSFHDILSVVVLFVLKGREIVIACLSVTVTVCIVSKIYAILSCDNIFIVVFW